MEQIKVLMPSFIVLKFLDFNKTFEVIYDTYSVKIGGVFS